MKLSQIRPNPNNPRVLRDEKFKKLVKSIEDFPRMMELRPIVTDAEGVILGGNMRYRALQSIYGANGEIPDSWVVRAEDLTEEQKREFVIKDNSAFGEWDWDALANDWDSEELAEWGLDLPDFATEPEKTTAQEDDFDPEAPVETVCKAGDIWQLGRHRLMCGDSTDAGSVAVLMDGNKADMLLTDPPYGIKADKGVGGFGASQDTARKYSDQWDEATPSQETFAYLLAATDNQIIFGGNFFTDKLPIGTAWIVWDKVGDIKFKNPYSDCELAWTSFAKVTTKKYTTIQQGFVADEKDDRVHPTQKPVKLIVAIMQDFSQDGDLILDTFGGSGTTLIAAEQLNRKCYMMELDPHYCDVIIARWEKLTGRKAVKL